MSLDDQKPKLESPPFKGILPDFSGTITKINDILDMVKPVVAKLSSGVSSINITTEIPLPGGTHKITINSVIKVTDETGFSEERR